MYNVIFSSICNRFSMLFVKLYFRNNQSSECRNLSFENPSWFDGFRRLFVPLEFSKILHMKVTSLRLRSARSKEAGVKFNGPFIDQHSFNKS